MRKGSKQRKSQIPDSELKANWDRIFNNKLPQEGATNARHSNSKEQKQEG